MTEIERKALALLNEVEAERSTPDWEDVCRSSLTSSEALCRAIERHEAFRQEVSDAVEAYLAHMSPWPDNSLRRFIFPKPDPLVEALNEAGDTSPLSDDAFEDAFADAFAKELRQALAARGLKIVEVE